MKEKENSDKENRKDEDDVDMDILVGFLNYRLLPQVKNFTVKFNNFYL